MDVIYDLELGIPDSTEAVLLDPSLQTKRLDDYDGFADLLQPIMRQGLLVQDAETIHEIRKRAMSEAEQFVRAHGEDVYPVGLEKQLFELKQKLVKTFKP